MNTKQNFFVQLDGGWGDIIANTYEETNRVTFIDNELNLYISLDKNSEKKSKLANNYEQLYKTLDGKYNFRIYFSEIKNGPVNGLIFGISVNDLTKIKRNYVTGITINKTRYDLELLSNNVIPLKNNMQIDYQLLDKFLNNAKANLYISDERMKDISEFIKNALKPTK